MTATQISSPRTVELAEKYVALWNEPDADRRRRMIAELWTQDGRHILQPPAGDPRDRGATRDRPDGDPRGTGIRGDRGSRGQRLRALGRLRRAELPRARRRRSARRRRQAPLGGGRQGRRRWSQSGSASSSSPRTAGSSATTRSSSPRQSSRERRKGPHLRAFSLHSMAQTSWLSPSDSKATIAPDGSERTCARPSNR